MMFKLNPKNAILTIIALLLLGSLSSCTKRLNFKWIPEQYRNKFHFGKKARMRHLNRIKKKHSLSHDKYDNITIVKDSNNEKPVNANTLDLTYTCPDNNCQDNYCPSNKALILEK